jgi:hypothetical protein
VQRVDQLRSASSATPSWASPELFARTREVFEPLYGRALCDDEIAEILTNVGQLFRILLDAPSAQRTDRAVNKKT